MHCTLANFRTLSAVFIVLTIVFAASTGYFAVNPTTVTQTTTATQATTVTKVSTSVQTVVGSALPAYTVGLGYNSSIGFYLTNGTGFTLYLFKVDKPSNGTSACNGTCATNWPAFFTSKITVPPGLSASSFSTITRKDGSKQVTYNGWPLYHFHKDLQAGNTFGQGIGTVWFAYTVPTPPP